MDRLILYIIGIFFVISGIDFMLGSPLKLGGKFEDGIKTMGALGIGMIGIYSFTNIIASFLGSAVTPISKIMHLDPSIFPAALLATDMGGFAVANKIALTNQMGLFSGVVIAATIGTTISFTIPVGMNLISKEDQKFFAKGAMIGIITIPVGCLAAGLWMKIEYRVLLWNLTPILIFAILLAIGLLTIPDILTKIFNVFGKTIIGISIIGLLLQGIDVVFGFKIVTGLVPLSEATVIVAKVAFVLSGAFPMLEFINRIFKNRFEKIGHKFGINSVSVSGILGNLASNLLIFGTYKDMNPKGKIVCASLAVSGTFIFGGQFGFIAGVAPKMLVGFLIAKAVSGILSVPLAMSWYEYENKKYKIIEMGGMEIDY